MCIECGCGQQPHEKHDHPHRVVSVHESIFADNDRRAERNRGYFRAHGLFVVNLVSSPGAGKTALLEKTLGLLPLRSGVVVGDLETDLDAIRLRKTGTSVVQVATGTLCHLDAAMVARAVGTLNVKALAVLFIENVGNLVCPAAFDLGEDLRVTLLSVPEGEDKPLKYPPLFRSSNWVVVTKIDLEEACGFDREACLGHLGRVAPKARILELSSKTGAGMDQWCDELVRAYESRPKGL